MDRLPARAPAHRGEDLLHRAELRRRRRLLVMMAVSSCGALAAAPALHSRPVLIWNASASAPLGLYLLSPPPLRVGDMVAARPPGIVARLAAARHYLPMGVLLVKSVAAGPGDHVCAVKNAILVNGKHVALRLAVDSLQRPLPSWTGCRWLGKDEFLLLNADCPRSFDGRYFGLSRRSDVIGRVTLIWRR